jgi:hypothetical protein
MNANHEAEELLVGAITARETAAGPAGWLGVKALMSRSTAKRPMSYVVVTADEQRAMLTNGLIVEVEVDVTCVAQLDEPGELAASKARAGKLGTWLADPQAALAEMCAAGREDMLYFPIGLVVEGAETMRKERSQGERIGLRMTLARQEE